MEHPPKQGLKLFEIAKYLRRCSIVLMEHPPKQGLKQKKLEDTYNQAVMF